LLNEIKDLLIISPLVSTKGPLEDVIDESFKVKIKEKANRVLEALSFEFKLFKELTSVPND